LSTIRQTKKTHPPCCGGGKLKHDKIQTDDDPSKNLCKKTV